MSVPQPPARFETVQVAVRDGIGALTLDRPAQLGALNAAMLGEIGQVLDEWEADDAVRGIIVTGTGERAFAAGADIAEVENWSMADGLANAMQRLYDRIEEYPKPTLAALNGAALGGGLELAMACDIRIAVHGATMGLPETALGVLPGAGGTQRLSRLVGAGRALEMVLTGRALTAEQAERHGLVTTVVPAEDLLDTATEIMTTVLRKGPLAIRLAKMVIRPGSDTDQRTGMLLEQLAQTLLYTTEDKAEGTAAFLAKRRPEFGGR
ncbi:enoyl-CoA hydratase/isomerase family protein [Brachybacterium saurashtrense]|uniref:enoyl-CoA hydratase n=1 Tax=Brachybacterium saurashtrense TaxID=556288 RepID=A0A345YSW3_9MICO|nr:enoyl-CoA hydratase-related protein [Brachybacterium saurashtrense]AXK47015.1 enoyl-CoA hydratase/isomerase family protein [Brachybacterium saurashtrense]RRR20864.1 enoyl-CoA hydratase/isomerase family protein [Brachybacterium saurashtrense]